MWLRAARNSRLAGCLAAALALVVCSGAFDWGHTGGDDPDCNVALVHHDHAAHEVRATPTGQPQPAGHCYLCHSLRLLHAALNPRDHRLVVALQSTRFGRVDCRVAGNAAALACSSRAPPSVLL
jgi:hypothetical protein